MKTDSVKNHLKTYKNREILSENVLIGFFLRNFFLQNVL